MAWTKQPTPVIDQFWGVEDAQELYDNADYLYDQFDTRHVTAASFSAGDHDDQFTPRAWGVVAYAGSYGAGGYWSVTGASGLWAVDLPGGGDIGRGRIHFNRQFGAMTYTALVTERASAGTADAADSPSAARPWLVQLYNRQTRYCDFLAMYHDGAVGFVPNSNGCQFSIVLLGT